MIEAHTVAQVNCTAQDAAAVCKPQPPTVRACSLGDPLLDKRVHLFEEFRFNVDVIFLYFSMYFGEHRKTEQALSLRVGMRSPSSEFLVSRLDQ